MPFKVLIIDDQLSVAEAHKKLIDEIGFECEIEIDPLLAIQKIRNLGNIDLVLLDINMPQLHGLELLNIIKAEFPRIGIVIATVINDAIHAIKAIKSGAFNYLLKPLQKDRLKIVLENYMESIPQSTVLENAYSKYITQYVPFKKIFERVEAFSSENVPVLISGETGTGKELIANLIHAHSKRKSEIFVALNLAAISESLFESELFGHAKGAFTGANSDHLGFLEKLNHGTIFLDEIGEISLNLQKKLLRVLQDGSYYKLGETTERKTNVRFIFATNKNLSEEITEKRFREDLYYRISSYNIHLPPLRDRSGDVELLTNYFLKKYASQYGRSISSIEVNTLSYLSNYDYPGNIRELEGIVSSAILLEQTNILTPESLPSHIKSNYNAVDELEQMKVKTIMKVLNEFNGNQTKAAAKLGLARGTLNRTIKKFKDMGLDI